jgi:hypothetical protein
MVSFGQVGLQKDARLAFGSPRRTLGQKICYLKIWASLRFILTGHLY